MLDLLNNFIETNKLLNLFKYNLLNAEFNFIDYFTILANLILLFFVDKIIVKKDTHGVVIKDYTLKVRVLRIIGLLFLVVFAASTIFGKQIGATWSQTYLLLLTFYLANHWINNYILILYGDKSSVDNVERYTDNYISQLLRIAVSITTIIILFFTLIQIWNLKELLESGSAFVTLGIILFATKDFWLEEVMSSLAIHAKGTLIRGAIVELEDKEYYIILETKFIGTRLKNLKTKVEAIVPNKIFVRDIVKIHTIEKEKSNNDKKGKDWIPVRHSLLFNIGYDSDYEAVETYFNSVMEDSSKECSHIGTYELNLINNGDHAVTWEILYYISNPFHMKKAKDTINLNAFKKQKEYNIDLSTPITYIKK